MMPLSFADLGQVNTIKKVGGKTDTKKFLESLGFVPGGEVSVISKQGGNVIVKVRDSRIAIGEDMARRIMV